MIKSYCKINLSLRVLKKNKDGFHDIQSNVFLLNIFDEIKIKKNKENKDNITFRGKFKKFVNKTNNSIINILKILRSNELIPKKVKYKIIIDKNIPVFAGLGGGTSNAAFILKHLVKKKLNFDILKKIEQKVGTDFRIFFNKKTHLVNLKKIEKFKKKYNFNFILVYPNVKCSTRTIYSNVKNYRKKSYINISKIINKNKFIEAIKREKNDLQHIVVTKFKILDTVINFIKIQKGCYFSRMTGSGSVCYGMFESEKLASFALKKIKKKFPKYWTVATKTI